MSYCIELLRIVTAHLTHSYVGLKSYLVTGIVTVTNSSMRGLCYALQNFKLRFVLLSMDNLCFKAVLRYHSETFNNDNDRD